MGPRASIGVFRLPLHVVLVEPEIAANAGNIARTCACTGAELHLIQPLGFSTIDRRFRRAGLDYWGMTTIHYHNSFDEYVAAHPYGHYYFTATQAERLYTDVTYRPGDHLVFGKESEGLSEFILENYPGTHIRIPMRQQARSLNLSNATALVVYEALRQWAFPGMS